MLRRWTFDFGANESDLSHSSTATGLISSRQEVPQRGRIQRFSLDKFDCWVPYRRFGSLLNIPIYQRVECHRSCELVLKIHSEPKTLGNAQSICFGGIGARMPIILDRRHRRPSAVVS